MKLYTDQLSILEDSLSKFENESFIYKRAELAITACQDCLTILRLKVSKNGFRSEQEECTFFKDIKPKVVGYLYFYINLIELERHKPIIGDKNKHRFLAEFVSGLKSFFLEHREFYEYYLRRHTHKDAEFFCRKIHFPDLHLNSISTMIDANFNTSHDLILARIIGNTNTINYIRNKISRKPKLKIEREKNNNLQWTGAKSDLIELIYALHETGTINHGNTDIKELATLFQQILKIDLGEYYRTYIEIRSRKINQTKFLDRMKTNLKKRMSQADQ